MWIAIVANIVVIAMLMNLFYIPIRAPMGDETTDRKPVFSWGGLQGAVTFMLDEDPEFGSPVTKEVEGTAYTPESPLDFGTYYWKVVSPDGLSSPTGMVTVVSEVSVSRGDGWLKNTGNTPISLERETTGGLTGMVVGINQTVGIGNDENVTARQA